MRTFSPYWDRYGLLAQKAPKRDGGDSAQRLGMYYYGQYLLNTSLSSRKFYSNEFERKLELIHNGYGNFRRHPDESKWYGDWPTSEFPIWPAGRPTSSDEASKVAAG